MTMFLLIMKSLDYNIDQLNWSVNANKSHTAYGEKKGEWKNPHASVLEYAAQGYDADLQAYRMEQRDYDPKLKRFMTPDPLFLESAEKCLESPLECSLYGYAAGNPVSFVDPEGGFAVNPWTISAGISFVAWAYHEVASSRVTGDAIYPTTSLIDFFAGAGGAKAGSAAFQAASYELHMYQNTSIATDFLKNSGVPGNQIPQIIGSFERGTLSVETAGSSQYGLRYFDNVAAKPEGRYLFETFPATREGLGLKSEWNQMTGIQQWQVKEGSQFLHGNAVSQGFYSGGQKQLFVPDSSNLMKPN